MALPRLATSGTRQVMALDRVQPMFAYRRMIGGRSGPGNVAAHLAPAAADRAESVTVSVPARLHFGFVDLNGGLGRRFGSLGLGLEAPSTCVSLARSARLEVSGPDAERARRYLLAMV